MSLVPDQTFETAFELWEHLSPTKRKSISDDQIIYRGHADAQWDILPTLLRQESRQLLGKLKDAPLMNEELVRKEFNHLRLFLKCCDESGVDVPNDSLHLREWVYSDTNFRNFHDFPSTWPSDEFLEVMAFGRLHGLPTRLIDWSWNPYIAVYFAVSEALLNQEEWRPDQRLAVFEFDIASDRDSIRPIRILNIRGSISPNVVAQQGLFTVHPSSGKHGEEIQIESLEYYIPSISKSLLKMVSIPVSQVPELYKLCVISGYNGARLFPGPEGAVRTYREIQMLDVAEERVSSL
ncbi:MAG: FRG domain-containing protein [Bacteroidetes bacterium]|nr:FRG domain-containing protein [Bacteroidota bacterium]